MSTVSNPHDVISAFLDDEPFAGDELVTALSDPAGRALLIDLIALRHIVQPDVSAVPAATPRWRASLRYAAAAAAVVLALVGGYIAGDRRGPPSGPEPPAPTRIVQAPAAWQVVPEGGLR
jgi:hypothetical protein